MGKLTAKYLLCAIITLALAGTGCFSIPFLGGGGPSADFEPREAEFDRGNVFVGYNGDGLPIVEIRLLSQQVTAENGLVVNTRIFPTENFEVVNIFRGLRSINYYPIERRFHRLELEYGRQNVKMKISQNLQVKGDKPIDAVFEHTGEYSLLPDTIDALKLKFQDVDNWAKLPVDTLDAWYAAKEQYFQIAQRRQQRNTLVESYRRAQDDDYTKTFTQYDSLYVTTNNAYVYLDKDVSTDILYTLSAGDQIDYGVSDGVWVEIPIPDSLKDELMDLFEKRQREAVQKREQQRRMARSARGGARMIDTEIDTTLKLTGYMLDVMVQKEQGLAIAWEKNNELPPVDVPLFAKVLNDREVARVVRRDSIAKAYQDSIKAVADSAAAIAAAADSVAKAAAAPAQAGAAAAAADAAGAAQVDSSAQAASAAAAAAAAAAQQQQPAAGDTLLPGEHVRTLTGPNGETWTGTGPPPWAGKAGKGPGQGQPPAETPPPPAADSSSGAAPDSSTAGDGQQPAGTP